jgi:Flp pilus assembly protein TadG
MVGKRKLALIRSFAFGTVSRRLHERGGATSVSNGVHSAQSPAPAARKSLERGEKGAEMLEFTLVVTALLTLMLGIVVFARAYNIYQTISRAAREGARMAVLPSSAADGNHYLDGLDTASSVSQANSTVFSNYIAPVLTSANLDPSQVLNYTETVGWLDPGDTDEQCGVTISFQYPYQLSIPFTSLNLTTIDLGTHVQMRRENDNYSGGAPTCP